MILHEFNQALAVAGLSMVKGELLADGGLHRYRVEGDKAGSLNGWYVLHDDDKPFGAFGSWKTGQSHTWHPARDKPMSANEQREFQARMAAAKAARQAEDSKVKAEARVRAAKLWERAKPACNDHAYLVKKQVSAFGIRDLRGQLVVPVRDTDGILHSLQFIGPDGRKTFLTGGRKRGCYHAMGRPVRVLCLAEGYATGATVFQATGYATAVAFDAGNMLPVAQALRAKFPGLELVICADNDHATLGNPGLTAAAQAAQAVRAVLAYPRFGEVGCHV